MRLTGAKSRTAKYRLGGDRDPDYAEIVAFLRSDHGFDFLEHVMGDAAPKWWRLARRALDLGELRKRVADQQRRIAQLEMSLD